METFRLSSLERALCFPGDDLGEGVTGGGVRIEMRLVHDIFDWLKRKTKH